jgi:hypothetical protein
VATADLGITVKVVSVFVAFLTVAQNELRRRHVKLFLKRSENACHTFISLRTFFFTRETILM